MILKETTILCQITINKWDQFDINEGIRAVETDQSIGFDKTLNKSGEEITKSSSNQRMYQPGLDDEDLTPEEIQQRQKEMFLKGTSGARPNTKLVIKGGAQPTPITRIQSMKDQGNNYFKTWDYDKAIESYSKWLAMNPDDIDLKVVLYSNRSQWYLNQKDYESAEKDSLSALRLNKFHVKSIFRHGTALYYLKRFKESRREFNNLLKIDINNKDGIHRLEQIEQKLSKIKQEAYDKISYGEIIGDTTSTNVQIIEVDEINLDEHIKKQKEDEKQKSNEESNQDSPTVTQEDNDKSEPENIAERESKQILLSKTDVSNISRSKGETQIASNDNVYDADELEEFKKLEEERNSQNLTKKQRKKQKKKEKKKKNRSKVVVTGEQNTNKNPDQSSSETDTISKLPKSSPSIELKIDTSVKEESPVRKPDMRSPPPRIQLSSNDDEEDDFKLNLEETNEWTSINDDPNKLTFTNMHEIHNEEYSKEFRQNMHNECDEIKQQIDYDEDCENLNVVKDDEGWFYAIKHSVHKKLKPILKVKNKANEDEYEGDEEDEPKSVFFNMQNNSIRDFGK